MSTSPEAPNRLLPPGLFSHRLLAWIWIVPQAILGLLNVRAYLLVSGEMSREQAAAALQIGCAEAALLAFGMGLTLSLRRRRADLSWAGCWPVFLAHLAYLWWTTACVGSSLLPPSVTLWILPPETVIYTQFALIMPALFCAALRLACFDTRRSATAEIKRAVLVVAWIPLLWLLVSRIPGWWRWPAWVGAWVVVPLFVLATVAFFVSLLRLAVILCGWAARRGPRGMSALTALVALAGPLGGLWLNRSVPFPADYQAPAVYLLAVLNGVLLLVPPRFGPRLNAAVWLAQAALFPFTFYFFAVFLPFLPLGLIAVLAAGAGFLVLVPTALFLLHGHRLLAGIREAEAALGPRAARVALALSLAAMPAAYTIGALMDRAALRQAMNHVYSPDFRRDDRFAGRRALVGRGLDRMRDFKEGRRMPVLSGYYNWLVFDGLTLPTPKLIQIERALFGAERQRRTDGPWTRGLFGKPQRSLVFDQRTAQPAALPDTVRATDVRASRSHEAGATRALVAIAMTNSGTRQSEFVGRIELPDGALVSGFWLTIGAERAPGRLVERKTAMWVYQTIRNVSRRDPGVLTYLGPNRLELRVFPVEPAQARTVEVELLTPDCVTNQAVICGQPVDLRDSPAAEPGRPVRLSASPAGDMIGAHRSLPRVTRQPYLHVIVDWSVPSAGERDVAARVEQAAARFPGIRECTVSLAGGSVEDICPAPVPVGEAVQALRTITADRPRDGGFCRDRAVKRALYRSGLMAGDTGALRAPVIVVVQGPGEPVPDEDGVAWSADLAPDFPHYFVFRGDGVRRIDLATGAERDTDCGIDLAPVTLWRVGSAIRAAPASAPVARVPTGSPLTVFDPTREAYVPVAVADGPDRGRAGAKGMAAWSLFLEIRHNPARGRTQWVDAVRQSQDAGVLLPLTAWIVVENSAQWRVMERQQARKLRGAEQLEIRSVPDGSPGLPLVAALFIVLIASTAGRSPAAD